MKRFLLGWTIVWLALAYAYYSLLAPRVDSTAGSIGLSLLVATFTVTLLGSVVALPLAVRDALVIGRGLQGAPFRDGSRAAAIGPLSLLGRSLKSPFEGTSCVAYTYAIDRDRGNSSDAGGRIADYRGLALAPAAVAAPQGTIRLLGFPNLDSFPSRSLDDELSFQRAEKYVAETTFEPIGSLSSVLGDVGKLMAVLTGEGAGVRKDYRLPGARERPELEDGEAPETPGSSWLRDAGYTLSETCVPVGASVCATGLYAADRNAIVASPDGGTVVMLFPGDGSAAPRRILAGALTRFAIAAALCAGLHGAVWFVLGTDAHGHRLLPRGSVTNPVQSGDVAAVRKALSQGADPNLNESGAPPLFYAAERGNLEMVKALLEGGARTEERDMYGSTPLMGAARYGHADVVRALIAAGADVNAKNSQFGTSALDDTIEDGYVETADALRAAGAIDETVTAKNGRSLSPGGGEPFAVCRRFLRAVFDGDAATMQSLWERPGVGFDKVDWAVYRSARTAEPKLVSGFASSDAATLIVRGSGGGRQPTLRYQLVRTPSGDPAWKIRREWILPSTAGVP